ncbi:hypothetical protein [Oceanibium sediminis]|nr:hypothetical protein [Oceanibium sediminis]
MSLTAKLAALVLLLGVAACAQQEEPAPAPVIEPEPVFTGKV